MTPKRLKNLFYGLLVAVVLLAGLSLWFVVGAIGGIEAIQSTSDDLKLPRFRIAAKLQTQLHQLSAAMVRYQMTGDDAFRQRYDRNRQRLEGFIEENRRFLDTPEEKAALQEIENRVAEYFEDAEVFMDGREERERPASEVMIQRIRKELDEIIKLANVLGEERKDVFRTLMEDNRVSAGDLQWSIIGSFGVLAVALAGLIWLGYLVFIAPLRVELAAAQALAGRREELANVGILASGIAHEVRNPLTAMKARAYALKALVEENPKAIRQAEVIEGEIDRLERVVRSVLDFAKPAGLERERVELDDFMKDVHEWLQPELAEHGVKLRCSEGGDLVVQADRGQMKQVMLNLVRNAGEACAESGGEVELGAGLDGSNVTIFVRDNGPGIPEEYQAKLFEPFYSKKPAGTGLGLSIARNIVLKHGGELSFQTAEGKGTTFMITLPA